MKMLVIGAGSVGKRHMKNAISLGHEVSVVDPRQDRIDECDLAQSGFLNIDDALQECWDGVIICSPPNFHIPQLKSCQSLGIPILMEKPLSNALSDALTVDDRSNILLGYTYRWWPPIQYLKDIIDSGCLGNILNVRCCMAAHLEDWHPWEHYTDFFMAHKHLGGGALLDESHILDLVLWFFGKPEMLSATVSKLSSLNITTDDNVEICMEYPDKFVNIHLDLFSRPHRKEIVVVGENGTAEWQYDTVSVSCNPSQDRVFNIDRNEMFLGVMKDYIALLEGVGSIRCRFEDGCNVLRIIDEVNLSSNCRRFVKCDQSVL